MTRSSKWLVLVAAAATVTAGTLVAPVAASAQGRAEPRRVEPRRVVRPVVVVPARRVLPVFHAPFYNFGGYAGWHTGWYGWHGHPYGFGPYPYPYPYRGFYRDYSSAARIQVQPSHAEVFVDGHFVGIVDDFDGWTQRLRVAPGERELEIFLDGYRPFRQKVLFRPGATIRIQHELEPLPPGETPEARPNPSSAQAYQPQPPPYQPRPGAPVPVPRRGAPAPPRAGESQEYGAVAIRVQPVDAEVYVNGELWESPEPGSLTVELAGGLHSVEIRREGYRPYVADVQITAGHTTTLNVSLSRR